MKDVLKEICSEIWRKERWIKANPSIVSVYQLEQLKKELAWVAIWYENVDDED